jgi:uncharacterized OsmC-like protein
MSTQTVKRWSVNAVSEGQTPLTLFCDGRPLTQSAPATVDNVSPVQYLLIAVASCFALSCRAVITQRKLARISFEVVATGEKGPAPTSRLTNIAVVAIFRSGITESEAALIAEQAKPLCTVTNTLLTSPDIQYSSRAIKERPADGRELPAQHVTH